jgi:uncharacterized membrane protein YgcG
MKKFLPVILVVAGLLMAFNKPIMGLISPADLSITIAPPPAVMPSIYKVYENSDALNGKYSLFQMVITNNSDFAAKNVEVSYSVTNYIENTVAEKIPLIQPGQTVVVNCYPHFPEKIVEKMTGSKETVKTTVKGSNIKTQENDFSIAIRGRNEFMYTFLPSDQIRTSTEYFDNMPLLSCLVTPEDPIIKYLTQQIQEKVLKGETASVTNKEDEGVRVLQGIYLATVKAHMVYSGTSGVPDKISDVSSIVQNIRLPREVITGKTGLCIELSLLYASILANAGMDPVVYLIPGHAYPGFRMNGRYYALESTAIGGEGIGGISSPQQAYESGMKELERDWPKFTGGEDGYNVVDIRTAIKEGAVAMELKDDNFLRQKIDEIAKMFGDESNQIRNNVQTNQGVGGGGGNNGGGNDGGGGGNDGGGNDGGGNGGGGNVPSGYNLFEGVVTFAYPSSWKMISTKGYMPQCKYIISNGSQSANVQVYSFPGYNKPEQALQAINQSMAQYGYGLQYQVTGQAKGYTFFSGQTGTNNQVTLNWVAAFKANGNGVSGIAAGANANTGTTHQQTLLKILNTIQ